MTTPAHDHPACRHCCRAIRVDGTPCRRKARLPAPQAPVHATMQARREAVPHAADASQG